MEEALKKDIQSIKQSFRLIMNGVASLSMRQKGLSYKLNWGASVSDLLILSAEIKNKNKANYNAELARELWKEDVRECKLLAIMIMPAEIFSESEAEEWINSCYNQELSEALPHYLLQYVSYASSLAFRFLVSNDQYPLLCALHLLRKVMIREKDFTLTQEISNRLHTIVNCQDNKPAVRKIAMMILDSEDYK